MQYLEGLSTLGCPAAGYALSSIDNRVLPPLVQRYSSAAVVPGNTWRVYDPLAPGSPYSRASVHGQYDDASAV